ncbi:MAG TPA: CtsR family transcriptional regulator [Verrucomicrobiae bacterium]|nr:CtsR family transcriptional regulator [Verrucomicrobiae bacterium]
MGNLVDKIEEYIKKILSEDSDGFIVIQRSLLASRFECAPSQINYVLSTRFSVDQGYLVESRRGGGGYLRIVKLDLDASDYLENIIQQLRSGELAQGAGEGLIKRMAEEGLLSRREGMLLKALLDRDTLLLQQPFQDELRARLMAATIRTLVREDY